MGHVRDLPKSKLGVDEKKKFKPDYRVLPAKKKVLDELKKSASGRGGALTSPPTPIAKARPSAGTWPKSSRCPSRRRTASCSTRSPSAPSRRPSCTRARSISNKVNAQQARRVLDRLVGYKLSPLLWEKVRRGLSAGRVQSVAVRLITEREREIQAFVPVEYWSLHARLKGTVPPGVRRHAQGSARAEGGARHARRTPQAVMTSLDGRAVDREVRHAGRAAAQSGGAVHHLDAPAGSRPQAALHGEEDDDAGPAALRGHRSRRRGRGRPHHVHAHGRRAHRARGPGGGARVGESQRLGREYLPDSPPAYRAKKSAQEAHEAVRPSCGRPRAERADALPHQGPARALPADLGALPREPDAARRLRHRRRGHRCRATCLFRAQGSTLKFAGFMAVYVESREESDAAPEEEAEAVDAAARGRRGAHAPGPRSQAALHPAAAALHRGLAGQDARGAGHRAAVDLRADPLDHSGPGLRPPRAGHAVSDRARHAGQ